MKLRLCINCLQGDAVSVEVGPPTGTQYDTWRQTIPLCPECRAALLTGDMGTLAKRYADERTVTRETI